MKQKLTELELRFCHEYVIEPIGAQAATRAGYSAKTANRKAYQLLQQPLIQQEIARLRSERMERVRIREDEVLARLQQLLRFSFADIIEVKRGRPRFRKDVTAEQLALLQELQFGGKAGTKIKAPDLLRTIALCMKHLGMLEKRQEDEHEDSIKQFSDALDGNTDDLWGDEPPAAGDGS